MLIFSLCALILSIISSVQAFHWAGNVMYDLEDQGSSFDTEAATWTSSISLVSSAVKTTQCGSNSVLGGYNIMTGSGSSYWYKIYTGLPTHNTIYFTGTFYMIDQWSTNDDHFHIFFDSYDTIMWWIYSNYNYATADQWGNTAFYDLDPITIKFTVPHTSTSLQFRMQNHFPKAPNLQSVGFRDIIMTFATENPVPSFSYCGISSQFVMPTNPCAACANGNYLSSGTCSPCDSSCKTCNGAGPSACTACDSPKVLFTGTCAACDSSCLTCSSAGPTACATCASKKYLSGTSCLNCDAVCTECSGASNQCISCITGYYNYWNGSCLTNCPFPLSKSTTGGQDYCKFSCSTTSDYLYWDGSCSSSCPSPYISETQGTYLQRKFCWFPCKSNEYLYWNGSCLPTCPNPLQKTTDSTGAKSCSNPCGSSSVDYLFYNQSCLSTCPSPLSAIVNPGVQYCLSPCSSGSFLYENKTCIGNCLLPFVKRFEPNAQFCDRPCDPGLFWYKNTSCIASCPIPYVQITYSGVLQCLPPCPDSEFFYEFEKECSPQCESPFKMKYSDVIRICYNEIPISLSETTKIQGAATSIQSQGDMASGGMKAAGAMNSGSPGSALLAGLSSMLQYIRYMKINYPPRVQMLFLVSAGSPISLGFDFDIPSSVAKKLDDNTLPDVFEKYKINSNFVSNLWDFLMTLLIVLIVIGVLSFVKFMVPEKRYPRTFVILSKIVGAIRWNVPIMMVCSSSGDIFFFASLQIRSSSLNSFASIMCFCVSLLMMIVVFGILIIGFKILRNFRRQSEDRNWADKWKGYEILYEEYEQKSIWSLSYMILFIIRGIIFNFTLANLFNFPLIQCIIINISNVLMFSYLLYLRPLKNFLGLVQLFVNEGLVNIIGVSIIILAIMDKAGISGQSTRVSVGDAIYFVIKVFNTFGLVFMGLSLLVFLISLFKVWRNLKAQKINSPLKIFKAMIFGEVAMKEEGSVEAGEVLKKARIRKPPRKHSSVHATNKNQGNEVIYIEETEMSRVQMMTDISQSELFSSVSGAHLTPTPGFFPNIHAIQTEEDVSDLQMTEMDNNIQQSFDQSKLEFKRGEFEVNVKGKDSPSFQDLSLDKSQIIMTEEAMRESIKTPGASEIEVREIAQNPRKKRNFGGFLENLGGRIKDHFKPIVPEQKEVMEERIETGASSDIKITEIQNDDDNNVNKKSDGFLQNWGRLKGRMKARGATNISLCQDQGMDINEKKIMEERVEAGISTENSQNGKTQNQSVEFLQNWTKFKRRMKARGPTNVSLHQDFRVEGSITMKESDKEGEVMKGKIEIESLQDSENFQSQIKTTRNVSFHQVEKSDIKNMSKKEERIETEATDIEVTEVTETHQNDNKSLGFIKNWRNLKGRMKSKELTSESFSQRKKSQINSTNTDLERKEITETLQNEGFIKNWGNLKGRVKGQK